MSFTVTAGSGGGGKTERAPAGNHLAVLVGLADMGTQETEFQGEVSVRRQVYLVWELVGKKISGTDKNHVISAAVTFSLNEKATLRNWVEARLGRKLAPNERYDVTAELGQPCLLNVVEKNRYPRVDKVTPLPDVLKAVPAAPTYPPFSCTLEEFKGGKGYPEWFPWLFGSPLEAHVNACEEIGGAKPQRKAKADAPAGESGKDPIPF